MRTLEPFRLEEYLAQREFSDHIMFCASDVESRTLEELLSWASTSEREEFFRLPLKYTDPKGDLRLREELARMIPPLNQDQFLCFAGAEEAIYTTARVLLKPTDHAITITPCYQSLKSVAGSICEVSESRLKKSHGQWSLDLAEIESLIRPQTRIIFTNFPHNPTGFIPTLREFLDLIDLARKHQIYLFSDEVYQHLSLEPNYTLPSASTLYDRALSLGVTSKSFGLAGLRIGWVSSQDQDILSQLLAFKHYLSISNSAPSEFLSKIAIRNRQRIWNENQALIQSNFKILKTYFQSRPDLFEWFEPQGGCICYPRYLGPDKIKDLADELLNKSGVVILPDWIYEEENNHFRVSFGRKDMPAALARFSRFFDPSLKQTESSV